MGFSHDFLTCLFRRINGWRFDRILALNQQDHRSLTNGFAMAEIRGQISPAIVVPSHTNRLPPTPFTMLGRIALWFYSERRARKRLRPTLPRSERRKGGWKRKGGWRYDSHLGIEYLRSNGTSPSKYPQLWKSNRWTVYPARILGEATRHPLEPSRARLKKRRR